MQRWDPDAESSHTDKLYRFVIVMLGISCRDSLVYVFIVLEVEAWGGDDITATAKCDLLVIRVSK